MIEGLKVPVPGIAEQATIEAVLAPLDDKIELNRRTNETLEAMARSLFKSWFVDFDPVAAKSAGKKPFGMTDDLAALFPSEFVDSDQGPIPKGWTITCLRDVTSKIGSGSTPRGGSSVYQDVGVALIRSQNVHDYRFVWEGLARLSDRHAVALDGVTVQQGDVLINITGDSILRTCVVEPAVLPARVNQHVAIVRPQQGLPTRYLHYCLVSKEAKDRLLGCDAGGTRQAITKGHLEAFRLLFPDARLLSVFEHRTSPWFTSIDERMRESRRLAQLRDLLLPQLLSGEIRLRDAEHKVKEVV